MGRLQRRENQQTVCGGALVELEQLHLDRDHPLKCVLLADCVTDPDVGQGVFVWRVVKIMCFSVSIMTEQVYTD